MDEVEIRELEMLANASMEEIIASIDPKLGKLVKAARKLKQAKDLAQKLKIMCEIDLVDRDLCKYVDKIALMPPEKQKDVLKGLILKEALKKLREK